MVLDSLQVVLSVVIGMLAAIVYILRVLFSIDNKVNKIMEHLNIKEK
ncbi:MAG: hypothetical protein QS99_C0015G0032 [archaeon GW2011_AR4]|nr:MAG: hypothetical protein QS99_C0015G0032 [archaeon GW2011_AR4]